ncbi:dihydropyrimidinase [Candidatus Moduliflexus flocculans]|uniref:Dihydropyrimidinase n=1 Tax=Candidatus Moduliflexus flocculans TaxID=1499966 RepID=A0A0S6VYZ7_9BACT|nr:dihydropyrimidinase [Candidatus Moduliflexus flocculans]
MITIIKNGTIITAGDTIGADILIENGLISAIGKDFPEAGADEVIDASGMYIMPGGIDPHTHLDMPFGGTVSSDDFFTGHKAAAFGGTTCHIDFAIQQKGHSMIDAIKTWKKKAEGKAAIDYSFHVALTDPVESSVEEIPNLLTEGVSSLKIFMAYKGAFQVDDTTFMKAMKKSAAHGLTTMVHAENGDAIALLTEELLKAGNTAMGYHNVAHSAAIEAEATARAVSFVEITNAPLYIVHIACKDGLEAVRNGRRKGLPVMGETCVQYTYLTDQHIATADFEGAKYICSPPPKSKDDQIAVWEALRDNTVQTVATDHCPFWFDGTKEGRTPGKELGKESWAKVPNGVPGIEDRLPVMWHLGVNSGKISPNRFVEITSTNPAKIFGLYPQKGTISVGAHADLVIFDPEKEHTISAETHHMNVDYNCYEGMTVKGWPKQVMVRGKTLVKDGEWLGAQGYGEFIPRKSFNKIV